MSVTVRAVGLPLDRIDGALKVTGAAKYAYEYDVDDVAYAFGVQSTIAKGSVAALDDGAALAVPGVLAVISYFNAPRLKKVDDAALEVLQSNEVAYHGQFVAAVVAESLEIARHAAALVEVRYDVKPHDVQLRADRKDLYKPKTVNANFPTDTASGNIEKAIAAAPITLDATYTTPHYHNNPLEPHATLAFWHDDGVTLYDANQGAHGIRDDVAKAFGLRPERVRVISPYVGGGFGSKAFTHPHVILTVMAAKVAGRPVKLALSRQQMFSLVGYRTPTIQHLQLAAEGDGRLTAISHAVIEQTSTLEEFAEQTAVATRMMYAAPNRCTSHRLARLDVPTPSIMRAPGETPGMFALESAMDEMALLCSLDPIEFRVRNEPDVDPESGLPFSSRGLVACLREGARRFGWDARARAPQAPRATLRARRLVGVGVAASTYPARTRPSTAAIRVDRHGRYRVRIDASDIGTGTWTALTQIAADALEVPIERVTLEIGDSDLPEAPGAGGSMGISSWGSAIVDAAQNMKTRLLADGGAIPPDGLEADGKVAKNPAAKQFAMHGYGAQFAEVHVDADSGEVRVERLLGVFAVGRIINPKTARSQLIGGMTMGISMALHEETVLDPQFGHYVNHDLAEYHIAVNADVRDIEAVWIDEDDPHVNVLGTKGIGEIGIVGTAAAIANAVYRATGVRVRDLPIRVEDMLA